MNELKRRLLFLLLFAVVFYHTGAHISQAFVNYPAWKYIGIDTFPAYHRVMAPRAGLWILLPRLLELILAARRKSLSRRCGRDVVISFDPERADGGPFYIMKYLVISIATLLLVGYVLGGMARHRRGTSFLLKETSRIPGDVTLPRIRPGLPHH